MANLYSVPTRNALQYQLDATLSTGATSCTLNSSVTGIVQASVTKPGLMVIDRVDTSGTATPTKREYISFTSVSGSTISGLSRGKASSTDQEHATGAVVEFIYDVTQAQAVNDVIETEHNYDGTHKETALDSMIAGTEAQGDIIYHNGTIWTRLPAGSDGNVLTQASGVPSWSAPSSPMTDAGAYVKPTTDGDELRAYHSDGTSYTEIQNDGTDGKITTNKGHIILTPETSKLVKTAVLRQDDTSNTYSNNQVILTGWGYMLGTGASFATNESVTFGVTFSSAPIIVISAIGFKDSTNPSSITDFTSWTNITANLVVSGTSGFTAQVLDTTGTNIANTRRVGYSWIAIGTL